MKQVAHVGSLIEGTDGGEHCGHVIPHPEGKLTGKIIEGCGCVFIQGKEIATVGSKTEEKDSCCGTDYGAVKTGSDFVTINGKPVARVGDEIACHSGEAVIITGISI